MGDSFIGVTLLGYTILREIGEGGMGKVYLAENQTFGQQVAIKILDPVLARNPELRERFAQEARIQIALQHNNIVRVMNAQSSEELSFLVMEYIDGQALDQVLKRRGKLSVEESVKIFSQVLDAVGYAHDKGVIHRDLKPSNILVCADGTAKVTDFGIAKVLGDTKFTRTGTSMGSPDYMSPEQVLGKKDIDHRTDIYSLGATLYEMLTGRPPFVIENGNATDSDFLVKQAHVQIEPDEPSIYDSSIPNYISKVCIRALSKKASDRFSGCVDFIHFLTQVEVSTNIFSKSNESANIANFPQFSDSSQLNKQVAEDKRKLPSEVVMPLVSSVIFIAFLLVSTLAFFLSNRQSLSSKNNDSVLIDSTSTPSALKAEDAREKLASYCSANNALACNKLGLMLDVGEGGELNSRKAHDLYNKACEYGSADACGNLGLNFLNGSSVNRNVSKAIELFQKSCVNGSGGGCEYLSKINSYGMHLERNDGMAKFFMGKAYLNAKQSCDAGKFEDCYLLGSYYDRGFGADIDRERAARLYLSVCTSDVKIFNTSACYDLLKIYSQGFTVDWEQEIRVEKRLKSLQEASCESGNQSSCLLLYAITQNKADLRKGFLISEKQCETGEPLGCIFSSFFYGSGLFVEKNEGKKVVKLASSCGKGIAQGCQLIGKQYLEGDIFRKNTKKAKDYFKKGCLLVDDDSCAFFGGMSAEESSEEKIIENGRQLLSASCSNGSADGCLKLALILDSKTQMMEKDYDSFKLYLKSCTGGNDKACVALGKIHSRGRLVPKNEDAAAVFFAKACRLGNCLNLIENICASNSSCVGSKAVDLMNKYAPLVSKLARKQLVRSADDNKLSELFISGVKALLNAIRTYNPSGDLKFSEYVGQKVSEEIADRYNEIATR